jgi:hypothetical protein
MGRPVVVARGTSGALVVLARTLFYVALATALTCAAGHPFGEDGDLMLRYVRCTRELRRVPVIVAGNHGVHT